MFDTLSFNKALNILEKYGLEFRIIEWEVGNSHISESSVAIQVVAEDEESMDKAKDEIETECAKNNINVFEG